MFRITFLVAVMILVSQAPDSADSFLAYKDYITALLLSLLIKPWLLKQYS